MPFRNQKSLKKQKSTKSHIRKRRKKSHPIVLVVQVVMGKAKNGLKKKVVAKFIKCKLFIVV